VLRRALYLLAVVAVITASGVVSIIPSAEAAHPRRIFVASNRCTGHVYRPRRITLVCAHRGFFVDGLHYQHYGGRIATGTGFVSEKCDRRNCGASFRHVPGRITLNDVIHCNGHLYYGVVTWSYNGPSGGGFGGAHIGPNPGCPDYWGG
jgi:hypothetical protein